MRPTVKSQNCFTHLKSAVSNIKKNWFQLTVTLLRLVAHLSSLTIFRPLQIPPYRILTISYSKGVTSNLS